MRLDRVPQHLRQEIYQNPSQPTSILRKLVRSRDLVDSLGSLPFHRCYNPTHPDHQDATALSTLYKMAPSQLECPLNPKTAIGIRKECSAPPNLLSSPNPPLDPTLEPSNHPHLAPTRRRVVVAHSITSSPSPRFVAILRSVNRFPELFRCAFQALNQFFSCALP